jgi:hypothetical protein
MKSPMQILCASACILFSAAATAQTLQPAHTESPGPSTSSQLPQAPSPQPPPTVYPARASDSYLWHAGVLCGSGASTSPAATKPTAGCGAGITLAPLPVFLEVGLMGPQANRSDLSGYISLDGDIPLARSTAKYLPMILVGYSRLFETGNSLDYGLVLALPRLGKPKDPSSSLRIELRDYCTFANPTQHNIQLRIGWMGPVYD